MKVRRGDLFSSSSADACNSADEIRQAEPKWKSLGPWFNFWPSLSATSLASEFMSASGREVFIDGAVLWMRGNSLGLLPNAWGAFNRLPLKELPLLRVQFFMNVARLSQSVKYPLCDYARGPFIFSIKCLRECCSLLYCTSHEMHRKVLPLSGWPEAALYVSLPVSCKGQMDCASEQQPINPCSSVIRPRDRPHWFITFPLRFIANNALARFIMKRAGKLNNMLERYDVYAPIVLFLRHTLRWPRFSSDQCQ
jgi:hypothetical protein